MIDRLPVLGDLGLGGLLLGAGVGVALFAGTLLLVGWLLVRLPPTYFQDFHSRDVLATSHPLLRVTARVGRNVLGVVLVLAGLVLSLPGVPGQGVLTILIGLMLLDVPGKRRLERRILGRPRVLRGVNRLRARFGRPPLVLGRRRGEVHRRRAA